MAKRPSPGIPLASSCCPGPPNGALGHRRTPDRCRPAYVSAQMGDFSPTRTAKMVWAADAHRNVDSASALPEGTFGPVTGSLCPALAVAVLIPALSVDGGGP